MTTCHRLAWRRNVWVRALAPSVIDREWLRAQLGGAAERDTDIISA